MTKTIIYFLRHADVYNPKKILYGRLPGFSLSEAGKKKAKQIAKYFKKKRIHNIYTSPMLRARQTASILGKRLGLTPKTSKLLIETNDVMAGISLDIFHKEIQPKLYEQRFIREGQESIESQAERMFRFVRIVEKRHPGEIIIAVSHGDPIMILRTKILNLPFTYQYKKANYLKTGEWLRLICDSKKYIWG